MFLKHLALSFSLRKDLNLFCKCHKYVQMRVNLISCSLLEHSTSINHWQTEIVRWRTSDVNIDACLGNLRNDKFRIEINTRKYLFLFLKNTTGSPILSKCLQRSVNSYIHVAAYILCMHTHSLVRMHIDQIYTTVNAFVHWERKEYLIF